MKTAIVFCVVAVIFVSGCDFGSPLDVESTPLQAEASMDLESASKKGPGSTVVVTLSDFVATFADLPASPTAWFFYNDENDQIDISLGSIATSPGSSKGLGSVAISVSGSQRRNVATYRFSGTPLASITTLKFSTYNPSAGNGGAANRSAYLQFNVDFNGSDTWQRRMTFVPRNNDAVVQNQWQEWDAVNGGNAKWTYSGPTWPGTVISGTTARTWSQILAQYPNARIRVTDSFLGFRVGEPYANGYTEYIDKVVFGTAAGTTTFDFEPAKEACMEGGWQQSADPAFANQGQCIQYNNTSK